MYLILIEFKNKLQGDRPTGLTEEVVAFDLGKESDKTSSKRSRSSLKSSKISKKSGRKSTASDQKGSYVSSAHPSFIGK